jgi:uncharacterized 2Fe-2S/4Fe-4S cluster protein (DUF4445 family)
MDQRQVRVVFQPSGRTVHVLGGTKVLEAAGRAGLTIDTPCGGAALCGKCRVQMTAGACEASAAEAKWFDARQLEDGWRLACTATLCHDATVHIPSTSLFAHQQILTQSSLAGGSELQPAVRKVYLKLPAPDLDHNEPDLLRLEGALGPLRADLSALHDLSQRLREGGFAGTAVLTDHHLVDFEPGDTSSRCFGVAVDLGTTTLVGSLVDLLSGQELAISSAMNPQVSFGDDVVSRINHAIRQQSGLAQLREAVASALAEMIHTLCAAAQVRPDEVYEVSIAGNTTMQHLLCGLDVGALGQVPFVPVVGRGLMLPARELHLPIHPRGAAYVFPVIGGFVGGDTVAGMLAAGLDQLADGPVMMVDIGTNGEIVLAHRGVLRAASTAAGPAFEGARISCGMRATAGAIETVQLVDGRLSMGVIADVQPAGLCGSGLIDLVAEMLRAGIINPTGRLLPPQELPPGVPEDFSRRLVREDGQVKFVLARGPGGSQVSLTQRDVRELQLAAGAMRAGITMLLRQAGLASRDLQRVLLAGGFGSFIRRRNAQRMGLLPADVDHARILYIGNASLAGARYALRSTAARKRGEQLARATRHVELSQDPTFQMEFAEAMLFPPA